MLKQGFIVLGLFLYQFAHAQVASCHKAFALVELFTSQGCSSCAGSLEKLDQVLADSMYANDSVLLVSFHVDYWDNDEWSDTFGKSLYTGRQKEYQSQFGGESVYTPMLVVNGRSGFSGNNDSRLRRELKAIRHAARFESTGLKIQSIENQEGKIVFSYSCNPDIRNFSLQAALVTPKDTTLVQGGENKGQTLQSINTVRSFIKIPLRSEGSRAYLKSPENIDPKDLKLIFWVQSAADGAIMDVQKFDLLLN